MAALAFVFAPAAYAAPSGGGIVVDDLAKLQTSLAAQPANTAAAPYTVVLPAFTLKESDTANSDWGKVNTTVANAKRYVILDLGKCAFTYNTVAGSYDGKTGMNSIKDNSYIKGIVLPKGLTSIGERAFSYCTAFTGVSIPVNVTSIGEGAFLGCHALTGASIPAGVTSIGEGAFLGCSALASITVDGANRAYCSEDGVLFNKAKTTLIQYPAGKSGSYDIPADVTRIGSYAFSGCSALTGVNIPAGVTRIGDWAFGGCKALRSVTFGVDSSLTCIGNGAFDDCPALTGISIPAGVTYIGYYAFSGCKALTDVTFDVTSSLTYIGARAFHDCAKLSSITIPAGVTRIGNYAFSGCSAIRGVTFTAGSRLSSIGCKAFSDCAALTGVSIPAGVTSIGSSAFYDCAALTRVTFAGGTIAYAYFGNDVFPSGDILRTAYLTDGAGTYTRTAGGKDWTKR
jgi:hypothetical protein